METGRSTAAALVAAPGIASLKLLRVGVDAVAGELLTTLPATALAEWSVELDVMVARL
ncbi:MAG: hypothetical protein JWN61_2487, partial [Pseudonocardiales bacterium]|nr:hypothetical protein [Pseudonocardiales bacterium]